MGEKPLGESLLLDTVPIDSLAIVANLNIDGPLLGVRFQKQRPNGRFSLRLSLLLGLYPMVQGVSDQMDQGVRQGFDDLFLNHRVPSLDGELDLLLEFQGQVTNRTGQRVKDRGEGNEFKFPQLLNRLIELAPGLVEDLSGLPTGASRESLPDTSKSVQVEEDRFKVPDKFPEVVDPDPQVVHHRRRGDNSARGALLGAVLPLLLFREALRLGRFLPGGSGGGSRSDLLGKKPLDAVNPLQERRDILLAQAHPPFDKVHEALFQSVGLLRCFGVPHHLRGALNGMGRPHKFSKNIGVLWVNFQQKHPLDELFALLPDLGEELGPKALSVKAHSPCPESIVYSSHRFR